MDLHVCAIATPGTAAEAVVLRASLRAVEPEVPVTIVWLDGAEPDAPAAPDLDAEVVTPIELGLSPDELRRLLTMFPMDGVVRALVPAVLRRLLDRGSGGGVVWFATGTRVVASLDPLRHALASSSVVLAPRLLHPLPDDGCWPDHDDLRAAGGWNPNVVAATPCAATDQLLAWWFDRLRRLDAVVPGYSADGAGRVLDLLGALFDIGVLRDPGCAVSAFNLHERPLVGPPGDTPVVGGDGVALRWLDLTGLDPCRPERFGPPDRRARLSPSSLPALRRLLDRHVAELFAAGALDAVGRPDGNVEISPGVRLDPIARAAYADGLVAAERRAGGLGAVRVPGEPPTPFQPGGAHELVAWLRTPSASGLTRYQEKLLAHRPDLQVAFAPLDGPRRWAFRRWCRADVAVVEQCEPALLTDEGIDAELDAGAPFVGVNLVGYLDAVLGLGVAGRAVGAALESVGHPVAALPVQLHGSPRAPTFGGHRPRACYDVTVTTINVDNLAGVVATSDWPAPTDTPLIGLFFWETDSIPDEYLPALRLVDEVWAASAFNREVFEEAVARGGFDTVVREVPLPVEVPPPTHLVRDDLGLPDGFIVSFTFDFLSRFERKNPLGLVDAYTRAFGPDEGTTLVLKTLNGHRRPVELELLRAACAHRPDILVIDEHWPSRRVHALLQLSDVYASMHRCEGLGLTLAEAMAAGTAVVATGWSGNATLVPDDAWVAVPYRLVDVPDGVPPYSRAGRWAEPDLAAAADLLRALASDPTRTAALGARARRHLADRYPLEACGRTMLDHLDARRRSSRR